MWLILEYIETTFHKLVKSFQFHAVYFFCIQWLLQASKQYAKFVSFFSPANRTFFFNILNGFQWVALFSSLQVILCFWQSLWTTATKTHTFFFSTKAEGNKMRHCLQLYGLSWTWYGNGPRVARKTIKIYINIMSTLCEQAARLYMYKYM